MFGFSKGAWNRFRRGSSPLRVAFLLVFAVGISTASAMAAGLSLGQKHENRHEIDQLEDEWRSAMFTGDVKTMASLLADDYMAITPYGAIESREDTLQSLRSGRMHFQSLVLTDRKVRFYGTTAIVTSLANVQASTANGPLAGIFRYTRVYVRNPQGAWKIVSFEASRVTSRRPHRHMQLQ